MNDSTTQYTIQEILQEAQHAGIAYSKTDVPGNEYILVCSEQQLRTFLDLIINKCI